MFVLNAASAGGSAHDRPSLSMSALPSAHSESTNGCVWDEEDKDYFDCQRAVNGVDAAIRRVEYVTDLGDAFSIYSRRGKCYRWLCL